MKTETVERIINCSRCGKNHTNVVFKKFRRKVQSGKDWTHWAPCRNTGEPILMRILEDTYEN